MIAFFFRSRICIALWKSSIWIFINPKIYPSPKGTFFLGHLLLFDLQSFLHETPCSSKWTKNENTWVLLGLTCHEFLGHKVHSVTKRGDETNPGITIKSCKLVLLNASENVPKINKLLYVNNKPPKLSAFLRV